MIEEDRRVVVVQRKGRRGKSEQILMTGAEVEIENALTAAMQDARHEIRRAYRIVAGAMMYGSHDPNRVRGTGDDNIESSAWQREQTKKLEGWSKLCVKNKGREAYAVTVDVCAFEFTPNEVALQRGFSRWTAMRRLNEGLSEYCEMMGWPK